MAAAMAVDPASHQHLYSSLTASSVHTSLCAPAWCVMLKSHPDKPLVQFVLEGTSKGFLIGFVKPASSLHSARSNSNSALEHPDVLIEYLHTDMSLGHVAGPFPPRAVPHVHISRFGVIPKGEMVAHCRPTPEGAQCK